MLRYVNDKNAELNNCAFIKTVMMCMVVIYHSALFWGNADFFSVSPNQTSAFLVGISDAVLRLSCHIYVFMFLSGYLFCYLKSEKRKYQQFKPFLINKSKRLLIPYVCVALLWAIPFALAFFDYTPHRIFRRFALATAPNQLWYLIVSFEVFMIFYLLYDFFAKHDIAGGIAAVLLYFIGALGLHYLQNIFAIWQTCEMVFFFWMGFKIRQKGTDCIISKIPFPYWLLLFAALLSGVCYLDKADTSLMKAVQSGLLFALYAVGTIVNFIVWQWVGAQINQRNAVFKLLSEHTLGIYLFHQQIIYLCLYLLNGIVGPGLIIIINVVVSITLSLLITLILKKHRYTRAIIGQKP